MIHAMMYIEQLLMIMMIIWWCRDNQNGALKILSGVAFKFSCSNHGMKSEQLSGVFTKDWFQRFLIKRIQNLLPKCQSFLCFLFSFCHSLKEYSLPGANNQHFFYLNCVFITLFIFNSCIFFFYERKLIQYFKKMPNLQDF